MADERRPVVPPPVASEFRGERSAPSTHSEVRTSPASHLPRLAAAANGRPPVQFSMRTMLLTVTGVAVIAALASFVGLRTAIEIATYLLALAITSIAPLCFGTLALYCRGARQTFFLGAFVGSVIPLLAGQGSFAMSAFSTGFVLQIAMAAFNLVSALSFGWLALATRRFAERRGWHLPPPEANSEKRD
jgi:hypothetical protein